MAHYPLIVISDTHLGMRGALAELLFEFLEHNTCDTLVINGDFADGMLMHDREEMPEMHKRVLDLINARIAGGVKALCTPGNHDPQLMALNSIPGYRVVPEGEIVDPQGRCFKFLHGQHFLPSRDGKRNGHGLETLTEAMTVASNATDREAYHRFRHHFLPYQEMLGLVNRFTGLTTKFHEHAMASIAGTKYAGIFIGHNHIPDWQEIGGRIYGNSGDWVQNGSALAMHAGGEWDIIRWRERREELGLGDPPSASDPNPYAAFRPKTEQIAALFRASWHPAHEHECPLVLGVAG